MKKVTIKKILLITWSIAIIVLLGFIFYQYKVSKEKEIIGNIENMHVEDSSCTTVDTFFTSPNFGYSLKIPKGWKYTFQPEYGRDYFFNCTTGDSFKISDETLIWEGIESEEEVIKILPNSVITKRTFSSMKSSGYEYEITFPQHKSLFVITWRKTIDELPILSSLRP